MIETLKFGDVIENGWASPDNPTRRGYFVKSGHTASRMNGGSYIEVTDGNGKFWRLIPTGDHRITKLAEATLPSLKGDE